MESLALHYLQKRGLKLHCRNYRLRYGEIDLVMQDGTTLVFVEVRYRRRPGTALHSITPAKLRRIQQAARTYMACNYATEPDCRVDLVTVEGSGDAPRIQWIQAIG